MHDLNGGAVRTHDNCESFDKFAVGDVATFERVFDEKEFAAFAKLSGDRNPLHCDREYAATTKFGRPLVPLHMTLAPLSRVAGMIFPGTPSLYLGHEVRAAQPVFYGESIRYSARIEAINTAGRVLTLRTIAVRDAEVVLDTSMRVSATAERWEQPAPHPIIRTAQPARALVTGASGEIGSAIAVRLAQRGWSLLLQDRGADERRERLIEMIRPLGTEAEFVAADLAKQKGQKTLADAAAQCDDLEVIVHSASAGADAPLGELVETNYVALRSLTDQVLPHMLARQKGRILYVSSVMIRGVPGWHDYVAAKTMTTGFVSGIESRLSGYGVRGLSLLPGIVATPFSAPYRGDKSALLPEEVAEVAVEMIEHPNASVIAMEPGRRQEGRFGVQFGQAAESTSAHAAPQSSQMLRDAASGVDKEQGASPIADLVRRRLRLSQEYDLSNAGLGATPGWDSLSQIELMLEIESRLGISFSSSEIEGLTQFADLDAAARRKISG